MNEKPTLSPQNPGVVHLSSETQYAPQGVVSRTLLQTPACRVVLFGFSAGQELSEHTSSHRAFVQILSGQCAFSLGGVLHDVKAGDLIHMPPHLTHALRAVTDFSMLLTLVNEPS